MSLLLISSRISSTALAMNLASSFLFARRPRIKSCRVRSHIDPHSQGQVWLLYVPQQVDAWAIKQAADVQSKQARKETGIDSACANCKERRATPMAGIALLGFTSRPAAEPSYRLARRLLVVRAILVILTSLTSLLHSPLSVCNSWNSQRTLHRICALDDLLQVV